VQAKKAAGYEVKDLSKGEIRSGDEVIISQ